MSKTKAPTRQYQLKDTDMDWEERGAECESSTTSGPRSFMSIMFATDWEEEEVDILLSLEIGESVHFGELEITRLEDEA